MSDELTNSSIKSFALFEDAETTWEEVAGNLQEFRDHGFGKSDLDASLEDYLDITEELIAHWCRIGSNTHTNIAEAIVALRETRTKGTEEILTFSKDIDSYHAHAKSWDRRFIPLTQKRSKGLSALTQHRAKTDIGDYHAASVQLDINRILGDKQTYSMDDLERKNPKPRLERTRKAAAYTLLLVATIAPAIAAPQQVRPSMAGSMIRFFSGGH